MNLNTPSFSVTIRTTQLGSPLKSSYSALSSFYSTASSSSSNSFLTLSDVLALIGLAMLLLVLGFVFYLDKRKNNSTNLLTQDGLNLSVLRNEAGLIPSLILVYLLGSIFSLCFLILLFEFQKPLSELSNFIIPFLGLSLLVGGLFVLSAFLSFKQQKFYYDSLTANQIVQQIQSENYKLISQNDNHYVFKKNTVLNSKIVLVIEKSFFILYGPNKPRKTLMKDLGWRSID